MPMAVVKGSLKYCLENKLFFLFVLIVFFSLEYVLDIFFYPVYGVGMWIFFILIMGYGLQIIEDVINGGTRLPKIMPKKVVVLGLKGMIIHLFYIGIQAVLLSIIAVNLNFPVFDVEELFLDFNNTLMLMFNHDATSFAIFLVSGFVISYVATFFMELSLARLADGGQLRKSFNFHKIKHAIDIIGWKNYTIGYTKIILVVVAFSYINRLFDPVLGLNVIVGAISIFVSFIVEYRGMGMVYKVYTDNRNKANLN